MIRSWDGIRDDLSSAGGDGLETLVGSSFQVEGELRRRSGMTSLTSIGGIATGSFATPLNGRWLLIVEANGDIESVAL